MKIQLGKPIEQCSLNGNETITITRKLNGCRCVWDGEKLLTRSGKEYVGLNHIKDAIYKLHMQDLFLDGELLYKNPEGLSDSEAFQKGNGIANSKAAAKPELKFVIFDCIPADLFREGRTTLSYSSRRRFLDIQAHYIDAMGTEDIEILPALYTGNDHSEIDKWLDYAEENDWEGIMINLNRPYRYGRTSDLIKVKRFKSCDILCTGITEGTGRNAGTLGALICDYKGNPVRVGTGFSDEDRENFWENPEAVIGKIITVRYKEETHNKKGGVSIQFPTFECVREDKGEPSYN